jgi:hypothetical protein
VRYSRVIDSVVLRTEWSWIGTWCVRGEVRVWVGRACVGGSEWRCVVGASGGVLVGASGGVLVGASGGV